MVCGVPHLMLHLIFTLVVLRCSFVWEWALRLCNRRAALGSGVALAAHVALSKGARRQVSHLDGQIQLRGCNRRYLGHEAKANLP